MTGRRIAALLVELVLIVIAVISGAILSAWLAGWASLHYFERSYPHDGQSVLGVIFAGLLSGALAGFAIFFSALYWRWARVSWFDREDQSPMSEDLIR